MEVAVPDPPNTRQERSHILSATGGSIPSSAHGLSNLFGVSHFSNSNGIQRGSNSGGVGGHGAVQHSRPASMPSGMKAFEKSEAPPPLMPATAIDKIHAVIDLQTFEGFWEVNNDLFSIMALDNVSKTEKTIEEMTVLIIVFLEERMAVEKDVWELVVEKARAFLNMLPGMETRLATMEAEAREIVKKLDN